MMSARFPSGSEPGDLLSSANLKLPDESIKNITFICVEVSLLMHAASASKAPAARAAESGISCANTTKARTRFAGNFRNI